MDSRRLALVHARMVAPLVPGWNCRLEKIGFPVDLDLCRHQTTLKDGEALYMREYDRLCELLRRMNGIGSLPLTDPYGLAQAFLHLAQLERESNITGGVLRQVDRHRARAYRVFLARCSHLLDIRSSAYDPVKDQYVRLSGFPDLDSHEDVVNHLDEYGPIFGPVYTRVLSQIIYLGARGLTLDKPNTEKSFPAGIRSYYGRSAGFFEIMDGDGLPRWWAVPCKGR